MAGIVQPIQDILAALTTINVVNQDGYTVPLHSRIWNNQIKYEEQGKQYDFPKPAAFLEIVSPITYAETGMNLLCADININIHLVHEYYNSDGTYEQDLTIYLLRDAVIKTLSNLTPTACSNLTCNSETMSYDHDNLYHYILCFDCAFIDSKASAYDPAATIYINSVPPTALQTNVAITTAPISDTIIQPYKISS
mgnify:CR=1 FL=1